MKKVLLSSAAVLGLVAFSPAANAQDGGLSLDAGGHFKGYGVISDQDENVRDVKDVDWLQETEIHLSGETTLDNGLTVGAHVEAEADNGNDSFNVDESYAYFAGGWGRVNLGNEDGAAYLLQVSAPSADSNIDGIRQFVQPVNYAVLGVAGGGFNDVQFDYANDATTENNKLTYLSPNVQGFQAGVSYTPQLGGNTRDLDGVNIDDDDAVEDAWEIAARYEGDFDRLGVNLGAGYTVANEGDNPPGSIVYSTFGTQLIENGNRDDLEVWNIGADFDWGPFGLGAVYTESNNALDDNGDTETWVAGLDYTTGPFKIGGSYYTQESESNIVDTSSGDVTGVNSTTSLSGGVGNDELDTDRWTGGVNYSFGPGMSFRGSVSYIEHEADTALFGTDDEADATSVLLGTQVNF